MKNMWIIANWKSNKNISEALEWVNIVGPKIERREDLKVVVCPKFSCLSEVKKEIMVNNYPLLVGAQNISPFDSGAYTGEESAAGLKGLIDLAIIGHSERRQNFSETDEMVVKKVIQAKSCGIIPLVCIQGKDILIPSGVELVAYEPIFAIGSGNPDTPTNANKIALETKSKIDNIEVLYGGSVTAENVSDFISQDSIRGVLVGKASLDPEEFIKIVQIG